MERLTMVGVTHRGAALPLLERVSVPRGHRAGLLLALHDSGCAEAVVLSTCSRTEVYARPTGDGPQGLLAVLGARAGSSADELRGCAEVRHGHAAIEHLFRVSAGLESRVIGEVEIQGQVRTSLREAQAAGMVGPLMSHLFPAALRCAAKVHAQTVLGSRGRSLGHRAVEVGLAALGGVVDPVIIVVGSGRMATTAVEHLVTQGRRPRVAARNDAHAARLAGPGGVCPMSALTTGVRQADLLICATSAAHDVVTLDHVREAMAARTRPLTVVDLSVPRNVDPAVAGVPGVTLIDLEGMNDGPVTDPLLAASVQAGASIARASAQRYAEMLAARDVGPVLAALRRRVEQACLERLAGSVDGRGADPDQLARSARAAAAKLLHQPTAVFRAAVLAGDSDSLTALCRTVGVQVHDVVGAEPCAAKLRLPAQAPVPVAAQLVA